MRKSNIYNLYTNTSSSISNEEFNVIVNSIMDDLDKLDIISSNENWSINSTAMGIESIFTTISDKFKLIWKDLPSNIKTLWNKISDKIKSLFKKKKMMMMNILKNHLKD